MASLSADRRRLLFMVNDQRKEIRLGNDIDPDLFKRNLESLLIYKARGQPESPELTNWLTDLPDRYHDRLATFDLVARRTPPAPAETGVELADFVNHYVAKRSDIKYHTFVVMDQARNNLLDFFKGRMLADITKADAQDFRRWLSTNKGLAENTVRRRMGICRQFYNAAIDAEKVTKNPFRDKQMPVSVRGNPERSYFVTREEIAAVLDKCPDAEWRALVALARFGGLRTPSEPLALTWGDVCWDRGRFTVHASKTAQYENAGVRVVPLFPELEPHLLALFNNQGPEEYVITRTRTTTVNLRTHLMRIIRRAGLKPWPKLWQNMRATRQTELSEQFPIKTVCDWIGNSELVASQFYLQVPEEHFTRATAGCTQKCTQSTPVSASQDHTLSGRDSARSPVHASLSNVLTGVNRTRREMTASGSNWKDTPGRTRTANPLVRSQMLCPIELRARAADPRHRPEMVRDQIPT